MEALSRLCEVIKMNPQEVAKQLWEQIKDEVESDEENFDEGRCRVSEESLCQALEQVKAIQEGRLQKKNWRELFARLKEKDEVEESYEKYHIYRTV